MSEELEALRSRVKELEEILRPYLDADQAKKLQDFREERAERIVEKLFPSRNLADDYIDWNENSCWWNGANIDFSDSVINLDDGNAIVSLSSYVGFGETEHGTVNFPAKWLSDDDWNEQLDVFVKNKAVELKAKKDKEAADKANRQILEARATLARLESAVK